MHSLAREHSQGLGLTQDSAIGRGTTKHDDKSFVLKILMLNHGTESEHESLLGSSLWKIGRSTIFTYSISNVAVARQLNLLYGRVAYLLNMAYLLKLI
jgi:hypothetical protein